MLVVKMLQVPKFISLAKHKLTTHWGINGNFHAIAQIRIILAQCTILLLPLLLLHTELRMSTALVEFNNGTEFII